MRRRGATLGGEAVTWSPHQSIRPSDRGRRSRRDREVARDIELALRRERPEVDAPAERRAADAARRHAVRREERARGRVVLHAGDDPGVQQHRRDRRAAGSPRAAGRAPSPARSADMVMQPALRSRWAGTLELHRDHPPVVLAARGRHRRSRWCRTTGTARRRSRCRRGSAGRRRGGAAGERRDGGEREKGTQGHGRLPSLYRPTPDSIPRRARLPSGAVARARREPHGKVHRPDPRLDRDRPDAVRGAALPAALRRRDHRHQVRRPRDGRRPGDGRLRPRRRADEAVQREPGGRARRRADDQRHAEAARHPRPSSSTASGSATPPPSRWSRWCCRGGSTSGSCRRSTPRAARRSGCRARTRT